VSDALVRGRGRRRASGALPCIAVAGALLLSACVTASPAGGAGGAAGGDVAGGTAKRASVAPGVASAASLPLPLLGPASLGQSRTVTQLLRGEYGATSFTLRCVIKVDAQQLTVVGLTSLGLRAFTLHYDGQRLGEERAAQMPASPGGAELLNDLQLVYWPLATLQQAWHTADVEVSEPWPGTRRLQRAGRLLAEVHYASDPWNGRIWLRHFDRPYELYIESSPQEQ
jgi:hypothetical protein